MDMSLRRGGGNGTVIKGGRKKSSKELFLQLPLGCGDFVLYNILSSTDVIQFYCKGHSKAIGFENFGATCGNRWCLPSAPPPVTLRPLQWRVKLQISSVSLSRCIVRKHVMGKNKLTKRELYTKRECGGGVWGDLAPHPPVFWYPLSLMLMVWLTHEGQTRKLVNKMSWGRGGSKKGDILRNAPVSLTYGYPIPIPRQGNS